MKQKHLGILLGTLVLLLITAFLTGVFDREISTVEVPEISIPVNRLEEIRIDRAEAPLTLKRTDDRWALTAPVSATADSTTLNQFLDDLEAMELNYVISTNPERYGQYGVDSTGTMVTVLWPDGEYRLFIGNPTADFGSLNVRLGDDPRVFATRERLNIPATLDRWRDRTVVDLAPASVSEVEVRTDKSNFTLEREATGWRMVENGTTTPVDSAAVASWLGRFNPMLADGFLDDVPPITVRDSTTHHLVFHTTQGSTNLWLQERDENTFGMVRNDDVTYRLEKYRAEQLIPDVETFKN